jgi:hypothetical protein
MMAPSIKRLRLLPAEAPNKAMEPDAPEREAHGWRSPLASRGENAAVSGDCLTPRSARGEPGSQDGRPLRGQPLTAALGDVTSRGRHRR